MAATTESEVGLPHPGLHLLYSMRHQDINLPVHPTNQEYWLVEVVSLCADGRIGLNDYTMHCYSLRPMSAYTCVLGSKCWPLLGSTNIRRRDLGSSLWVQKQHHRD